ncbi:hypothetical protein lerEdw1_009200 [Lerista edwardsae]|nr:hypothetical protein lerEdw1_009200 [Lerista edwardsae]
MDPRPQLILTPAPKSVEAEKPLKLKEHLRSINKKSAEEISEDEEMHPALLGFTIASFLVGCLLGSLVFGSLADKYGRKGALLINDLASVVAGFTLAVSKSLKANIVYSLARFFTGVCTGVFSSAVPMYLGEIAPKNLRGSIALLPMSFISVGMLICQVLGGPELLGNPTGVPFLLSVPGILSLFQLFLLLPFPESPRYLLIQQRNEEGARQALQKLRDQEDVEDEIDELHQEDLYEQSQNEKQITTFKLLCSAQQRWQLICALILFATQQFSGIDAAYYYADRVFLAMKVDESNVRYSSALLTFLGLFVHGLSIYLVDTWGRRPLLLLGFAICIISCVFLTLSLELQDIMPWMAFTSSFLLLIFIAGIILGPNSIPYLMLTELFLQSSRASAYAIGGFFQWFLVLFLSLTFFLIEKHVKTYSFLIFLPLSVAGFFYILKYVPETKKKPFVDIRKHLEIYLSKRYQHVNPAARKETDM